MNEKLRETKARVIEHIRNREGVPDLYPIVNVRKVLAKGSSYIKDTLLYDPLESKYEKAVLYIDYTLLDARKNYDRNLPVELSPKHCLMINW